MNREHERGVGRALEAAGGNDDARIGRYNRADNSVRREHVDHGVDHATLVEQPLTPTLEVGVADAANRDETSPPTISLFGTVSIDMYVVADAV